PHSPAYRHEKPDGVKHIGTAGDTISIEMAGQASHNGTHSSIRSRTCRNLQSYADPVSLRRDARDTRRHRLWRHVRPGHVRRTATGRAFGEDTAGKVRPAGETMSSAARIEAYLEMTIADRGPAGKTLAAYRRDLQDADERIPGGLPGAEPTV